MKKIIYLVALMLFTFSCSDNIKEKKLPDTARSFISTHFPNAEYIHGEKDKDNGSVYYEVTLSGNIELEFDKSGNWLSVDCSHSFVPETIVALIPSKINDYIKENYVDAKIVMIDKEHGGYEIDINKLAGSLIFNSDAEFIDIDNN